MTRHWSDSITKRGWFVVGLLVATLVFTISHATRDVCWVGLSLTSCDALIAEVTK